MHHHRARTDLVQQGNIGGKGADIFGFTHRMTAKFDNDGFIRIAAHKRQCFDEHACLCQNVICRNIARVIHNAALQPALRVQGASPIRFFGPVPALSTAKPKYRQSRPMCKPCFSERVGKLISFRLKVPDDPVNAPRHHRVQTM